MSEHQSRPDSSLRLKSIQLIKHPTYYVAALQGEYSNWAYDEDRAKQFCGHWRKDSFGAAEDMQLDLEIGTGNGFFFSHYAQNNPQVCYIGIEHKFKPLIQSIRRAREAGCENARMVRYDARFVSHLFAEEEINNIFIHFPDPWSKDRQKKHRLIQEDFLVDIFKRQKSGGFLEFKTDNLDYFLWAVSVVEKSPYNIEEISYDLHNSPYASKNFVTHFETIFLEKGMAINYFRAYKR